MVARVGAAARAPPIAGGENPRAAGALWRALPPAARVAVAGLALPVVRPVGKVALALASCGGIKVEAQVIEPLGQLGVRPGDQLATYRADASGERVGGHPGTSPLNASNSA